MPVVINEFEVIPEPPRNENQAAAKKADEKGGQNQPPTDYEVKQMLERRMERMERVAAH
ncbi:MAG: hypothetical protein ABJA66_14590 [Actinomycetota bacterium]